MSPAIALNKELRALLPTFLAALATLWLATQAPPFLRVRLVLILACLAPIALGSLSVGHEYVYRTVTLLLAQPVGRRQIFMTKAAVLVPMVVIVAAAALSALPENGRHSFLTPRGDARGVLLLAPLCGLFVAPALSILCRSALAAIVFTIAIPGMLMMVGEVIGTSIHGFRNPPAVEAFRVALVSWSVAALAGAGAIATWFLCTRLQAIEGHSDVQMPAWLRGEADAAPQRRVPRRWAALVRKELRLHQLTFVVVLLYLLAVAGIWTLQVYAPEFPRIPIEALSVFYCAMLVVLIGSVPSAEERQLGTLAAQLLQPVAAWQQWAIKAGTAVVLALLLGIVLPLLVSFLAGDSGGDIRPMIRSVRQTLVPLLILTSFSLYVSSLSSSGVRAMISSLPVIVGAAVYAIASSSLMVRLAHRAYPFNPMGARPLERIAELRAVQSITDSALVGGFLMVFAVVLSFASVNHRRLDRSRGEIALQAAIILGVITLAAAVPALIWIAFRPGA